MTVALRTFTPLSLAYCISIQTLFFTGILNQVHVSVYEPKGFYNYAVLIGAKQSDHRVLNEDRQIRALGAQFALKTQTFWRGR